jgi:fringe
LERKRDRKNGNKNIRNAKDAENEKVKFLFATGGAGFCISRGLALKMMPLVGNGKFVAIGDKIRFPDDVTLGFIIEHLLKVPLTVVNPFHSHLERMDNIDVESFRDQVCNESLSLIFIVFATTKLFIE